MLYCCIWELDFFLPHNHFDCNLRSFLSKSVHWGNHNAYRGDQGGCYETFEDLLMPPDINIDHYVYCMGVSCRHVEHYLDDLVMSKDENCKNLDLARTQHNQLKLGLR